MLVMSFSHKQVCKDTGKQDHKKDSEMKDEGKSKLEGQTTMTDMFHMSRIWRGKLTQGKKTEKAEKQKFKRQKVQCV